MQNGFEMKLTEIQPSQLFISEDKLKAVFDWLTPETVESCEPLPVKRLNGKVIYTDGHTRALALYLLGVEKIHVYWDEDELDWKAYQICVDWCVDQGITDISHLEQRIIGGGEYERLWHDRCRKMQADLANARESGDKCLDNT